MRTLNRCSSLGAAISAERQEAVALAASRSLEERAQLAEMALARGLVVRGGVGHRVAVPRARVYIGAVEHSGFVERPLERRDLLCGHARVVVCKPEVELGAERACRH